MQPRSDTAYFGHYYMPPHAVHQARDRFPGFVQALTDRDIRKYIDDQVYLAQQGKAWLPARKKGEYVAAIPAPPDGLMYPLVVPSSKERFQWAIVSVLTEDMQSSWNDYPPEMPEPKLIMAYQVGGEDVFIRLESEDRIAEFMLDAIAIGVPKDAIEVYRQTPYSLTSKTKR